MNKNVVPKSWTPIRAVFSCAQRLNLRADEGLDSIQQGAGYPGATPDDEGIPITPIPSLIYPTADSNGDWHMNKTSSSWNQSVRPGRHGGKEDYID